MTLETEFWLNLPLSCSLGIFTECDCRVQVEYETDGKGAELSIDGWTVIGIQPEKLAGWLRKDDQSFAMFEAGVRLKEDMTCKQHGQGEVTAECLIHAEDAMQPDPDELRDSKQDRDYFDMCDRRDQAGPHWRGM